MNTALEFGPDTLPDLVAGRCRAAVADFSQAWRAGAGPPPAAAAAEIAAAVQALAAAAFGELRSRYTPGPDGTVDDAGATSSAAPPDPAATKTGADAGRDTHDAARPTPIATRKTPDVDGYTILGTLGRGGMGIVYRARQVGFNRDVALKMILSGQNASDTQIERFLAEAKAVAAVDHPNVVKVFEIGSADGSPFYSLELCPGGALDKVIKKEPQPPRRAAELVAAVARGMQAVHDAGVVHRDVKPANILLAADGTPKLTDFGLARLTAGGGDLTQAGAVIGTPSYMSPEMAAGGGPTVGPAADQYGLGATLYDLLVGRPPFQGTTFLETLEAVRTREPVPPAQLQPSVPRDLETVCLKAMAKDPAKRYPSAAAFADDLQAFLDGRAVSARPVGPLEKAWRWAKRNPRVAVPSTIAATVTAAAAVLGITFAVVFDRQKREAEQLATDRLAALEVAEHERRVADESYRTAREAVVGVADRLPDVFRKNLLARPAQQQVLAALGEAVGKQTDMAAARNLPARTMMNFHMKAGELAASAGNAAKAEADYSAAEAITSRLMAEDDKEKDKAKGNHALVLQRRANLMLNRRDKPIELAAVIALFRGALDLQRQVVDSPTTGEIPKIEAKQSVAGTLYELADLHRRTQKFADGAAAGEEALAIRREVAAAPATAYTAGAERKLAESLVQLGKLYTGLADDAKAEPCLKEAADRLAKLAAADPVDQGLALQAARAAREYGDFLLMRDRHADAAPRYAADLALVRKILTFPELVQLQSESSDVYYRTATLALKRGEAAKAAADYRRCRDVRQMLADAAPANDGYQSRLANALARCGDHTAAAAIMDKLTAKRPDADLFNAGCNYALCAGAVRADRAVAALPPSDRKLFDAYRDKASAALAKLVAGGYTDRVKLATDPDLDALRDDTKFITLLATLPAPAKRGAP